MLIEGGGEGDWRKMRTEGGGKKKLLGDKRCSNKPTMKNTKQTEPDLLEEEERERGANFHI